MLGRVSSDNGWKIRICVFRLRQFVAFWIGGRVCSGVGWMIRICVLCLRQLVAFWIWCGAGMETSESRQTCCDVVAKHAWCS